MGFYPMKQISKSLLLLFVLIITACTTAPSPPESLEAIRQEARKTIETECVSALFLKTGRRTFYFGVSGVLVDVFSYCKAYARSRVETSATLASAQSRGLRNPNR